MSKSFTESIVFGSHASSGFTTNKSSPYISCRHCKQMQGSSTKTSQLPQGVGKSDRLVEFCFSASSTRPSLPAASDRLDEQKFISHLEGSSNPIGQHLLNSPSNLARKFLPGIFSPHVYPYSVPPANDGRMQNRLGRCSTPTFNSGSMATGTAFQLNQLARTKINKSVSSIFSLN